MMNKIPDQESLDTPLARSRQAIEGTWGKDRKIVYDPDVARQLAALQKHANEPEASPSFWGWLRRWIRGY